jgi:hypothetical protein
MFNASISTMKVMVAILARCKKVPMLHGAPGVAKSAAMKQVCKHLSEVYGEEYILNDCRLSQKEPPDLGGLPHEKAGYTAYLPPMFMPRQLTEAGKPAKGMLFFDEGNRAERPTQQAAFQLIYDRVFGEYILPQGYSMVMAGNLGDEDMSIVNEWDAPFCNRVFHIRVTVLQNEWAAWMKAGRSSEYTQDMEKYTFIENPVKETIVVDFLAGHETHFQGKQCMGAFPTARTWEMLEDVIEHIGGSKADIALVNAFAVACVGEAAGIAFTKWFREREEFKPTLIVDEYSAKIKERFVKLSSGYKEEVYYNLGDYVNKMTKFSDKQKKNIVAFVFDKEAVPEEKAVSLMKGWADNATVINILQTAGVKFLGYFKQVKELNQK